jgi:hypothetical protein
MKKTSGCAVVSAAAHLQGGRAGLAPAGADDGAGIRSKMARSFTGFTVTLGAIFVVSAGTGMVLSGTKVGIVAALETGGRQSEIGAVFLF